MIAKNGKCVECLNNSENSKRLLEQKRWSGSVSGEVRFKATRQRENGDEEYDEWAEENN